MEIRLLEEIDMPQFWTLWVRALRDHPTAFGASYAWAKEVSAEQAQEILRQIRSAGGFILGALDQQRPIGWVSFTRQQSEKFRHKGDMGAIYVVPEARGRGIAKTMLTTALERIQEMADVALITLSVNNENLSARRLYETCGFRAYGIEPMGISVDGQYFDLLHMTYQR